MNEVIRQIKLSTGEEVLCEVLEDGEFEVVIRNALKMVSKVQDGFRFYTFKNFMVYQDKPDSICVIRADHIVSYANPPHDLITEYGTALVQMHSDSEEELGMTPMDSGDNVIPFKPNIH